MTGIFYAAILAVTSSLGGEPARQTELPELASVTIECSELISPFGRSACLDQLEAEVEDGREYRKSSPL